LRAVIAAKLANMRRTDTLKQYRADGPIGPSALSLEQAAELLNVARRHCGKVGEYDKMKSNRRKPMEIGKFAEYHRGVAIHRRRTAERFAAPGCRRHCRLVVLFIALKKITVGKFAHRKSALNKPPNC
jgi:hypothetical protein